MCDRSQGLGVIAPARTVVREMPTWRAISSAPIPSLWSSRTLATLALPDITKACLMFFGSAPFCG